MPEPNKETPATPPATPPAQSQNPNDLTPQQIREAAQPPAAPPPAQAPPAPAAAPAPAHLPQQQQDGTFALTLPTGQTYKGKDANEVIQQVINAQVDASRRITQLTEEGQRARNAASAALGHAPVDPTQPQKLMWDNNVYNELAKSDIGLAQDYYWGCKMGLDNIDDVGPALDRIHTSAIAYTQNTEVNRFQGMAPDFPGTQQAVDALMDTMQKQKIPFSAENLATVHRSLVAAKVYAPAPIPQQFQPQQQPQPVPQQQQFDPALYNPNPMGNYSFNPSTGFGNPAPMFTPQPQVAAPAFQAPPGYALVPIQGGPQPQYQVAPLPVNGGFPAQPLPTLTSNGAPNVQQQGAIDESTINGLDTRKLREFIETNLTKQ